MCEFRIQNCSHTAEIVDGCMTPLAVKYWENWRTVGSIFQVKSQCQKCYLREKDPSRDGNSEYTGVEGTRADQILIRGYQGKHSSRQSRPSKVGIHSSQFIDWSFCNKKLSFHQSTSGMRAKGVRQTKETWNYIEVTFSSLLSSLTIIMKMTDSHTFKYDDLFQKWFL